jgi:hypothetical protein
MGVLAVRPAAGRVRSGPQSLGGPGGSDARAHPAAGLSADVSPLSPARRRAAAAAAGAPDRGQPRQPPRRPRADLGVPAGLRQPRPQPLREGLLLPPSAQTHPRLLPGQHDPHGPHPLRPPGDRLLPRPDGRRRQHHPLPRGHALARRIDPPLPGRHRPARAEVPLARGAGTHPRHVRVLPQGRAAAASGANRGALRPTRSILRPDRLQAQLAGGRRRPGTAGPPAGPAARTGENTR